MIGRLKGPRRYAVALRVLGCGALLALLAGCSQLAITPAITLVGYSFQINATTGYSGELVTTDSSPPQTITGSGNQNFPESPASGQTYTMTLWKTAADGQSLELQLLVQEKIDGNLNTVVAESETTTDPNVPVRVVLQP